MCAALSPGLNRTPQRKGAHAAFGVAMAGALKVISKLFAAALILNEVRGIVTVALTWPLWWPVIKGVFHAAMRGRP
jgi:hypothetical protein